MGEETGRGPNQETALNSGSQAKDHGNLPKKRNPSTENRRDPLSAAPPYIEGARKQVVEAIKCRAFLRLPNHHTPG